MNKVNFAIVFVAILLIATVVYAYTIVSPTVTVVVQDYTLTLDATPNPCIKTDVVTFSGALTDPNGNAVEGSIITLYLDGTPPTDIGTDTTDVNGEYSVQWTATETGSFDFYSQAEIP